MAHRRTKVSTGVFLAVGVSCVFVASVAWACVPSGFHGQGTIDGAKTSGTGVEAGPRGSTVVLRAWQMKSRTPLSAPNLPLAEPATYRVLFLDNTTFLASGDVCLERGFVMKRTDGSKANNVAAISNGDADPNGHDGAFVVNLKVPTNFPGTTTSIPTGKSRICGSEQTPDLNQTATRHFIFKVTAV